LKDPKQPTKSWVAIDPDKRKRTLLDMTQKRPLFALRKVLLISERESFLNLISLTSIRCGVFDLDQGPLPHQQSRRSAVGSVVMLNDRENILSALREKAMKVREIMKRANIANEEACQTLLLKMRDEGLVKFDIHSGQWLIG
jgi:hypothetical protein